MRINVRIIIPIVLCTFIVFCSNNNGTIGLTEKDKIQLIHRYNSNLIELPKTSDLENQCESCLIIYISEYNQYFIGENESEPIDSSNIETKILANLGNDSTIQLIGDSESQWKYTIVVLDIIKKHGLKVIIKTKL